MTTDYPLIFAPAVATQLRQELGLEPNADDYAVLKSIRGLQCVLTALSELVTGRRTAEQLEPGGPA